MSDDPAQIKIAALAAISDLIVDLLSTEYEEAEIRSAIEDIQMRFGWQCGAECLVSSRSSGQWSAGQIVDIVVDGATNKEWLTVKDENEQRLLQRFSSGLLPIGMDAEYRCNQVIIECILNEMGISIQNDVSVDEPSMSLVVDCFCGFRVTVSVQNTYFAPNTPYSEPIGSGRGGEKEGVR